MIYVDVSAAVHSRAGLGRYAQTLARALVERHPHRFGLFYNGPEELELSGLEDLPQWSVGLGYKPWRAAVLLGQMVGVGFDRLLPDAELYHATEHLLMPLRGVPTVLTVHDLIYKRFPQYHKRLNEWYLNLAMPFFLRSADAIITISEASRNDLTHYYGVRAEKIAVVYEAAAPRFRPQPAQAIAGARREFDLPPRFLLAVGTIEPRKNLSRLLEALIELRQEHEDLHLVLVGRRGWLYSDFFRRLEELELGGVVHLLGHVTDEYLPAVYGAASAAVMPSLYEGFGLPVLEAMACGTPVASSSAASLPELGGEAACYFDPTSVEEMTRVLDRLLSDSDLREKMALVGLEQAAKFSWERAARETMAVYSTVLSTPAPASPGKR